ncbi:MAG: DUF3006 domain-containing protein [Alphaproteobacteria bacterium]|nr:DUF3006 domain-containing protein [Alphaproteobacteria bacterium]
MTPLQTAGLALVASTPGIVDRVEGDVAVIEWSADHWSELPVEALPPGAGEGDALLLFAFRPPGPDALPPTAPSGPIDLSLPSPGGASPPLPPTAAHDAAGATP